MQMWDSAVLTLLLKVAILLLYCLSPTDDLGTALGWTRHLVYHTSKKRHFKGGFGTNSKRSDGTLRSNTVDVLPGPGHYEIRTDMKTNKPSESAFGTSCFTSMSNRMQNSLKAQVKRPPIFETSQSWDSKCNLRNLYPLHGNTTSKIIQLNRNANGWTKNETWKKHSMGLLHARKQLKWWQRLV